MSHPILVTGAAGGQQGSTGSVIATLLLELGLPVRAFVHKLDHRSGELLRKGAEVLEGDLLNPASVQAAMKDVKRAYFTYPVAEGLLEATTIFNTSARDAGVELVVNNSQFQPRRPHQCRYSWSIQAFFPQLTGGAFDDPTMGIRFVFRVVTHNLRLD